MGIIKFIFLVTCCISLEAGNAIEASKSGEAGDAAVNDPQYAVFVEDFERSLNKDIDPCNNILNAVCPKEREHHKKSSVIRNILEAAFAEDVGNDSPVYTKIKKFYSECKIEADTGTDFFQKFSVYTGGFPALGNFHSEIFDRYYAVGALRKFGIQTIFTDVTEYVEDEVHIKLSPHFPYIGKFDEIKKKFKIDENLAAEMVDDYKEVRMELMYPMPRSNRNGTVIHNFSSDGELTLDLFNFKSYYRSRTDKEPNEKIFVEYSEFHGLDELFKRFAKVDGKKLANYLMVIGIQAFLDHSFCELLAYEMFAPVVMGAAFSHYFNVEDQKKHIHVLEMHKILFPGIQDSFYPDMPEEVLNFEEKTLEVSKVIKDFFPSELEIETSYKHSMKSEIVKKYFIYNDNRRHILEAFLNEVIPNHNKPFIYHFLTTDFRIWVSQWNYYNFTEKFDMADHYEKYAEVEKCMEPTYEAYDYLDLRNTFLDQARILTAVMKFVWVEHKRWLGLQANAADFQKEILARKNMTEQQFFFYVLASTYCDQPEHIQKQFIVALMNNNQFIDEFKCDATTPMNMGKYCYDTK